MLRVFEAFAGVGSQRMALRNIGIDFEVVGISDVDRYALLAYDAIHHNGEPVEEKTKEEMLAEFTKRNIAYNFSTGKSEIPKKDEDIKKLYEAHVRSKNFGDIRTIDVNELPEIDLFTYSFPCKNISVEGLKAGFDKNSGNQSSLVWDCKKIIESKRPKYLLMENVKNIVSKAHIHNFNEWCQTLEELGYNNYWKIYNGVDYGVPQKRERVMMVSILKEHDKGYIMPSGYPLQTFLVDILQDQVDDKFYIDREKFATLIKDAPDENGLPVVHVREANRKGYAEATIGDSINIMQANSKTRRGRVGKGVCNTINTSNWQCVLDVDRRVRRLTDLECWRLIGFSDEDYYKAKEIGGLSESKLYERAGRGIVVPMLEEIFKNLFK